jgi:hypothetical protein
MNDILTWAIILVLGILVWEFVTGRDAPKDTRGSRESDRTFWDDDDSGGGE